MKNTTTYYKLTIEGHSGYLAQDGYSKYYQRLTKINEGVLPANELYGLDQAREHAREYYSKKNDYSAKRRNDVLKILKVTMIEEEVEIIKAEPFIEETPVKFLIEWQTSNAVFAYFPKESADLRGNKVCYAHVGQHSSCSIAYARKCMSASSKQYEDLKNELIGLGYKLKILND